MTRFKLGVKWVILAMVILLVAVDLAVVVSPRYFLPAITARIFRPSECSLSDVLSEAAVIDQHDKEGGLAGFASKITLLRSEAGLDLWNTPNGQIWTGHGTTILPFLLYEQLRDIYEPKGHEVRRGDVVLDCGASIGVFTRKALDRGAARVVAIEPTPQTLSALRRNFESEIAAGRVVVYPKGVWDHDSELELNLSEANPGTNSVVRPAPGTAAKVRVPLTTIDKLVEELKLPRVDFIKMDIEGAEKPALKGAQKTLERFRPRMSVSAEHLADDFTAIPALVHTLEPRYSHKGCDCDVGSDGIKAMVIAFDPLP